MFVNAGRASYGGFLEAALLANKMGVRIHMSDALEVGCSLRSHLSLCLIPRPPGRPACPPLQDF